VTRRHFPLWTLLGVVLVVALLVGGGVFRSAPSTAAQRAAAIESVIRCPSCEDLTVAVSSAPTAITVRQTVSRMVHQGRSDQQIKDYLVTRYGSSIVLDPPTTGWSALVWVLPVVVGVGAVMALAVVLVRRRRDPADPDADVRGGSVDPVVLGERRGFLTQSLADADAEYLAGDLSDADYLSLRQRDLARLHALGPAAAAPVAGTVAVATGRVAVATEPVAVETGEESIPRADGATSEADRAASSRRGRNRWFLLGAVVSFAAALIVAVPLFTSDRLPGQTATGSISLSPSQQLARSLDQAAAVENDGQLGQAAQLYQAILGAHPDNEVALAQLGWLEYRIGTEGASTTLLADARAKLDQAVALAPADYAAHLYLGTVLLEQDGNAAGAVAQYRMFLAAGPPASVLSQAAPTVRSAFTRAGQAVPAGIPGG
jgi:cytochrome c-type biogenesis protein CcmH